MARYFDRVVASLLVGENGGAIRDLGEATLHSDSGTVGCQLESTYRGIVSLRLGSAWLAVWSQNLLTSSDSLSVFLCLRMAEYSRATT